MGASSTANRLWAVLETARARAANPDENAPRPILASVLPEGVHGSREWAEQFSRWALAHCVFRDGCYGGVAALHKHLCAWCVERGRAVPSPSSFGALLADEGFTLTEFGLVYGLLLREDWEAAHAPPPPPAESKRVAPRKPAYREALPWKA